MIPASEAAAGICAQGPILGSVGSERHCSIVSLSWLLTTLNCTHRIRTQSTINAFFSLALPCGFCNRSPSFLATCFTHYFNNSILNSVSYFTPVAIQLYIEIETSVFFLYSTDSPGSFFRSFFLSARLLTLRRVRRCDVQYGNFFFLPRPPICLGFGASHNYCTGTTPLITRSMDRID